LSFVDLQFLFGMFFSYGTTFSNFCLLFILREFVGLCPTPRLRALLLTISVKGFALNNPFLQLVVVSGERTTRLLTPLAAQSAVAVL
jgi:hypothetical protein